MMPIGEKAILEILLRQLRHYGFQEVVLAVGHLAGLMQAFFQDGTNFDLEITYTHELTPLGTAGPLALAPNLDSTFLVCNGDVLTNMNFMEFLRFHKEQQGICTIAMHKREVHINLGVIEQNKEDYAVTGYIEKPTLDYQVSMGMYIFEPRVLEYIPKGEYLDFPDLVKILISNGEKVIGYPFDGYWQDLGNPQDYAQACKDFDAMRSEFYPEI